MSEPLPIWIRLPRAKKDGDGKTIAPARCRYTGLSAAKIWELAVPNRRNKFKPPVRSVSMPSDEKDTKQKSAPGRRAATIRLVHLPSLLEYLDKLADEQAAANEKVPAE